MSQEFETFIGKCLQPLQERGKVAYRTFENGIIVLNDAAENKTLTISLPSGFQHRRLLDLYDGKRQVEIVDAQIEITVPRQSARIYLVIND